MPKSGDKKPRSARALSFSKSAEIARASSTPGPSGEPKRMKSLAESIKQMKSAKAAVSRNIKKLTPEKQKEMACLRDAKQVGNYKMPDALTSKGKGKGKGTEVDHRHWIPCPLLPGVPSITPPKIRQSWEVLWSHETTAVAKDDDNSVIEDTPPSLALKRSFSETTAVAKDDDNSVIEDTPPSLTLKRSFSETIAVVEDDDEDVIEGKPPLLTLKRPFPGVIQVPELPSTPVLAEIEFVDFMPTSNISRAETLGSDTSAKSNMSLDIDVEIERNVGLEANSVCEIDVEKEKSYVDVSVHPESRNAAVADLDEPNPTKAMVLMRLDAEEDQAIRDMAGSDTDVLHFDWSSQYENFEGVREAFTGPSGPTFNASGMSPLRIFEQIWDTSIIDHIATATNNYARQLQSQRAGKLGSRISRWTDVTREEIWRFLSILMLQSFIVNNVEREYWLPRNEHMRIGNFGKIMSYNKFLLVKTCLRFNDNSSSPVRPSKLNEIMPVIAHLNEKFSTLYLPEQNVAIDESLLLWKGRLSFSQKIATKRAREGIKSYEICESRTGYLWKMEVYTGKGHTHVPQEACEDAIEGQEARDEPENATSQIVFNLMRPLFGKGHTLVMDNFYNSPLLSRLLKTKHRTDTIGTLRLNREFVPEGLKAKTKKNMKPGEVCFSSTKDICVLVYKDNTIVPMISTFHPPEVGGKVKYGYYKYKPNVVLDYNLSMGGIDHKDQMLSSFPIERCRNLCWYKKLFRRLLNVSIHNASVIHGHGRTGSGRLDNRSFRVQLLTEMLGKYSPDTPRTIQPVQPTHSQMHLPVKVKTQRCKLCYSNKVRRTTVWRCGTCQVNLCIEGCYAEYHRKLCQERDILSY